MRLRSPLTNRLAAGESVAVAVNTTELDPTLATTVVVPADGPRASDVCACPRLLVVANVAASEPSPDEIEKLTESPETGFESWSVAVTTSGKGSAARVAPVCP